MNIFLLAILSLASHQIQYIDIKVVDENKYPIDGVYAQINNDTFLYSNSESLIKIPDKEYRINDSIYLSHLSYVTTKASLPALISSVFIIFMACSIEISSTSISSCSSTKPPPSPTFIFLEYSAMKKCRISIIEPGDMYASKSF